MWDTLRDLRVAAALCAILAEGPSLGGDAFCLARGAALARGDYFCHAVLAPCGDAPFPDCVAFCKYSCKADCREYTISALRPARTRQTWITSFWSRFIPCHGERPAPAPNYLLAAPRPSRSAKSYIHGEGVPPPAETILMSHPPRPFHRGQGTSCVSRMPTRCNPLGSSAWNRRRRSCRSCCCYCS